MQTTILTQTVLLNNDQASNIKQQTFYFPFTKCKFDPRIKFYNQLRR